MKQHFTKILLVITLLAIVCTFTLAFSACSVRDEDKLYVGLECAYAPFNYTQRDASNNAVQIYNTNYRAMRNNYANGYDIMIALKIAESLGKQLVVVKMEWDALIPALNAGTVDMIIAGMSPTEERKQQIDFSDPYYQSNLVLVVRKDGAYVNAKSLADFKGAEVAAQKGTFHDAALQAQAEQYGIIPQTPLENFPALINALEVGAIDAYVAEEPGAIENCASNPNFTYIKLVNNDTGFAATDADVAIAVGIVKGSTLTAQVNAILAQITPQQRDEMMQRAISLSSGENIVE